jgi:hypothetical protein
MSNWTMDSLKEHYDAILKKNDELSEKSEKSIDERFAAQKELSSTIHLGSQEAIKKAEAAQNQYNVVHNDLTRKNELMQRREDAEKSEKNILDRMEEQRKHLEDKINSLVLGSAGNEGRRAGTQNFKEWIGWAIALILFLLYITGYKPNL